MDTPTCEICAMNEAEKPSWGEGPWQTEQHYHQWRHAGLPCIVHRGGGSAWCG